MTTGINQFGWRGKGGTAELPISGGTRRRQEGRAVTNSRRTRPPSMVTNRDDIDHNGMSRVRTLMKLHTRTCTVTRATRDPNIGHAMCVPPGTLRCKSTTTACLPPGTLRCRSTTTTSSVYLPPSVHACASGYYGAVRIHRCAGTCLIPPIHTHTIHPRYVCSRTRDMRDAHIYVTKDSSGNTYLKKKKQK